MERHDAQPVIEILAEAALRHLRGEIAHGGRDEPNVHRYLARATGAAHAPRLERTLRAHGDNRTRAARELGISRATLIKKIREYELGERQSGAHLRLEDA